MLDLLLFAFVVWLLLEYRLDEREGRLFLAAFVFGAGMAENWAMVGFLPIFVMALIWCAAWSFSTSIFWSRMLFCGLAGLSFYFLLPAVTVFSGKIPISFWQALQARPAAAQWLWLKAFFTSRRRAAQPGADVADYAAAGVCDGDPLEIHFRRQQPAGHRAGETIMFHVVHAVIFGVVPLGHVRPAVQPAQFCLRFARA